MLDAVATLLAGETNYGQLRARLTDEINQIANQENSPVVLLERILEAILRREHDQKIVTNLKPLLALAAKHTKWKDWDSLYDVDEQCRLLLATVLEKPVAISPDLPPEVRDKFEEHLKTWLPEHPFLRDGKYPANAVFESYLLARALSEPSFGFQGDVEGLMADPRYKPSRLVADFYLRVAEEARAGAVLAQHVGLLYEALLSAETDAVKVRLSLEGSDPDDAVVDEETEGEFDLVYIRREEEEEIIATRTFKTVIRGDTRVTFGRQLRDALIILPCTLVLGTNAQEFIVGPRVDAKCRTLEINAGLLIVSSGKESPGSGADGEADVVLEAGGYVGAVSRRPIVRGTLHVSFPGSEAYPWTEYHGRADERVSQDAPLREAYRRFRRIVMTLRSHSRGELARYRRKIEHARTLQGHLGEALLAKLVRDGVLRPDGQFYFWAPERAASVVGISWHDLRLSRSSETLNRYLLGFLAELGSAG